MHRMFAMSRGPAPHHRSGTVLLWAIVASLLLHVGVLAWMHARPGQRTAPFVEPRSLQLSLTAPRATAVEAAHAPRADPPRALARRPRSRDGAMTARRGKAPPPLAQGATALPSGPPQPASRPSGPMLPASPNLRVPLFPADDEATRQVIRDIARDPRGNIPTTPARSPLAAGIERAARPDCLKSPAGGRDGWPLGGLLALPALIYDAASGNCGL